MFNRKSVNLLFLVVSLPFLIITIFLFRFQILEGSKYQRIAENNFVRVRTILPVRGDIYDRNFLPIAVNQPSTNLYMLPVKIQNIEEVAAFVSRFFPITEVDIRDLIYRNRFRSYHELLLFQNVEYHKVVEISEQLHLYPSLFFQTEHIRSYTINNHFTGYVNQINRHELDQVKDKGYTINSLIGKTGLEKQYEEILRGSNGYQVVQVDATGRNLELFKHNLDSPAVNGSDMILTIDMRLQRFIEEIFPEDIRGAALAIDVRTGGVLAYVSRPVFNLNMFAETVSHEYWSNLVVDPTFPLLDRVTMANYPPGSVFKTMVAAVALDNKIITQSDNMTACRGSFRYGNRTYNCWQERGHGSLNVIDAIKHSCNVFFYDLSLQIPLIQLHSFMDENRLIARTNIDLPTERAGFFPDQQWYVQRLGSSSLITGHKINLVIGQGEVLMTPLQITAFYAAIANDGLWNQPYLFSRIIGINRASSYEERISYSVADSDAVKSLSRKLTMHPETLNIIQEALYKAANESGGTALAARIRNGRVYGKTGTAENPASSFPHAWFAGYAKWQEPEIALTVILENVEDGSGGRTAAPLAGRIFNFYQENVRGISVSQLD